MPALEASRTDQAQCPSCAHPVAGHYDMGCIHVVDGIRCGCIDAWRDEPLASTRSRVGNINQPGPTYPPPRENPLCQCVTPLQPMVCSFGHILECHYPRACNAAGCGHLERYYESDAAAVFRDRARTELSEGAFTPYVIDLATGSVRVMEGES